MKWIEEGETGREGEVGAQAGIWEERGSLSHSRLLFFFLSSIPSHFHTPALFLPSPRCQHLPAAITAGGTPSLPSPSLPRRRKEGRSLLRAATNGIEERERSPKERRNGE